MSIWFQSILFTHKTTRCRQLSEVCGLWVNRLVNISRKFDSLNWFVRRFSKARDDFIEDNQYKSFVLTLFAWIYCTKLFIWIQTGAFDSQNRFHTTSKLNSTSSNSKLVNLIFFCYLLISYPDLISQIIDCVIYCHSECHVPFQLYRFVSFITSQASSIY